MIILWITKGGTTGIRLTYIYIYIYIYECVSYCLVYFFIGTTKTFVFSASISVTNSCLTQCHYIVHSTTSITATCKTRYTYVCITIHLHHYLAIYLSIYLSIYHSANPSIHPSQCLHTHTHTHKQVHAHTHTNTHVVTQTQTDRKIAHFSITYKHRTSTGARVQRCNV